MYLRLILPLVALMFFCLGGSLLAQDEGQGQRQRQRRGGQQRLSRTALLQLDAVQKELEMTDEQLEGLDGLRQSRRRGGGERGERGERGEGKGAGKGEGKGGKRGEGKGERGEGKGGEGKGGQRGEDRRGGSAPTMEGIEKEMAALNDILLQHQIDRLNQIFVQVAGAGAFADPMIAQELGISEDQQQQMRDAQQALREQMREMAQSDDREAMREQMGEMRQQLQNDMLAVLSDEQNKKLDEMKGEAFEMPEGAMRRGGGNRRGGGDRADF